MEGRQEKLGFGSFKGRVSRLRGLPPKFCIPLVFGHMSARSDLRENVFWTPPVVRTSPFPANHTVVHQPHTNPTLNQSCFSSTKKHRTFHSSGLRVALWR